MIKTKSIYDSASEEDGLRVLVTRYWPRGVKKERSHLWLRDLGPCPELIRAWKSGQVTWAEFRALYLEEFRSMEKKEALEKASAALISAGAVANSFGGAATLLCTCRDEASCHRGILKDIINKKIEL